LQTVEAEWRTIWGGSIAQGGLLALVSLVLSGLGVGLLRALAPRI